MMQVERSKNAQLAINMLASLLTSLVGFGTSFVLTPYIVKSLGAEAYGFIGLSTNILSYAGLITVALNSMAGRFITIKYIAGEIEQANKYYASVFFSNIILAFVILIFATGCIVWIDCLLDVTNSLIVDVRLLFAFLAVNQVGGLLFNIWGVSTFIKNRLELSNIRSIIGSIINGSLLVLMFGVFTPHIWYIGLAGNVMTIYLAVTNKHFTNRLTPELKIRLDNYDWQRVKELFLSGLWNLFSKLGNILGQGLDLLIANVCIGSVAMGYFALTKNLPFLILSVFQNISNVFSPIYTAYYAKGQIDNLINELNKSIRILSLFTAIPLSFLYVFGDNFYSLWLPNEDSSKLQFLTILGTMALPYTMPLESFWNIFTITNKLKYSTIFTFLDSVIVFIIVVTSMIVFESIEMRLIMLAGTRSACGWLRGFIFLPMYGAHCLGLRWNTFYRGLFNSIVSTGLCVLIIFLLKSFINPNNWIMLGLSLVLTTVICLIIGCCFNLTKGDRLFIINKLFKRKLEFQ